MGLFSKKKIEEVIIYSPMCGEIVNLENIDDPVFSQKMMGDGVAITPNEGTLVSPVKGKINLVFPTNHAVGIEVPKTDHKILIHIGLDTVNLKGEGFDPKVSVGDSVNLKDELIKFDLEAITSKVPSTTTPIVVEDSSMEDFKIELLVKEGDKISCGDELMKIVKK